MLKKLLAVFAALSFLLLTACGGKPVSETTTVASSSDDWSINEPIVTKVARDENKWPIGKYTEGVPKPAFGKIIIVGEDNISSPDALITVIITGVSEHNFSTYCQQLRIAGFYELDGFEGGVEDAHYFFGVSDAGKKVESEFVISPDEASGRMRIKIYG